MIKHMFCFPFAGGSSLVYKEMKEDMAGCIDIIPLEYSGHGSRFDEPLLYKLEDAAKDLQAEVLRSNKHNYSLFGHSLGSQIAFETALRLRAENNESIDKLIVSGMCPPHLIKKEYEGMSKEQVFDEVYKLGQIPAEIKENKELYEIYSEIIYADIAVEESCHLTEPAKKLDIPIIAFCGTEDEDTKIWDMREWANYTTADFKLIQIKGDHFFLFNNTEEFYPQLREQFEV